MNIRRLILVLLGSVGVVVAGPGCATHDPADSSIPWNRPANWEQSLPGMSNF